MECVSVGRYVVDVSIETEENRNRKIERINSIKRDFFGFITPEK